MHPARSNITTAVLALASVVAAACGGNASFSPVAPSPASAGASIIGTIRGTIVSAPRAITEGTVTTLDSRGVTISIVGTGNSTTADSQGQFTLSDVPTGTVQLNFTAPGSNATVTLSGVGPNDRVQIAVTVNGNNARIDSEHHNNGVISARITSIDNSAKTFQAGSWTIKVTDSTVIRHGSRTLQFSDLRVGDHVQVRGARDGSTVSAIEIKVEHVGDANNDDDDDDDDHESEIEGRVSSVSGSCPGISFSIGSTKVTADKDTNYDKHITCGAIRNDLRIEVKGIRQSDGSVLARRISIDD